MTNIESALSKLEKADKIIKAHYASHPEMAIEVKTKSDPDIISVDFDGTLFDFNMMPNWKLISKLIEYRKNGKKVILNTFREGERLDFAISKCKDAGLEFDAVNENLPVIKRLFGDGHRKIYADLYIDDQAEKPEW